MCIYVYIPSCVYISIYCVQACVYMCVHVFVYVYKYVCVCMYICAYVSVCVCICMQMNTTKMLKDMKLILHVFNFSQFEVFIINIHYSHYKNETRK